METCDMDMDLHMDIAILNIHRLGDEREAKREASLFAPLNRTRKNAHREQRIGKV